MRASRVLDEYADVDSFVVDMRNAVNAFAYRTATANDGRQILQVPGYAAEIPPMSKPHGRWRSFKSSHIALSGYEAPVVGLVVEILKKFSIKEFFDVGAADGFFSFLVASHERKKIDVQAFEMALSPFEVMIARSDVQGRLNGKVNAHLAGLSDRHEGKRNIWYSRTQMFEKEPQPREYREAWHRRLKFALRGIRNRDELKTASVLLTSIDAFCSASAPPQFIKIDVDGYEGKVLKGAEQTLRSERPFILLELHQDDHIGRTGWSRQKIADYLFGLGYDAVYLTNHHNVEDAELLRADAHSKVFSQQATRMLLFF